MTNNPSICANISNVSLTFILIGAIDFDDLNGPAVALTNFTLESESSGQIQLKLSSGFIGVSQNSKTLAVRPALGWITYYL